ncbi:DNA polymerase [Aeromonas sp. 600282]|uniref:DNA polymerase n=1 Tax=Aeromonas sp. 600282 TaxID=2712027 RepID=UPI003BA0FCDB
MILCNSDYHTPFAKILLSNTVTSKNPFYNTSPNFSLPPKYPPSSIFTEIQSKYAKFNCQIHQQGVEIRPTLSPINNAQGGHVVLDALGRSKDFINMNTDDVFILQHTSKPFATTTGRNVTYGPSLTSLKKKFWSSILNPTTGCLYILLDYGQEEAAIAACFANDQELMAAYLAGDLYLHIGSHPHLAGLDRDSLKKLVLPYSYGQSAAAYAKEHKIPLEVAQRYWRALKEIFYRVDAELNHRSQLAFRNGYVSCLDWAARVTPLSNPLAVRNWPVQAAGADIMRRAVIGLVDAGIDLRLTIHDAFLIRVPIAEQDQQVAKAIALLKQASALVLDGFELNVKVDGIYDGQISGEMM